MDSLSQQPHKYSRLELSAVTLMECLISSSLAAEAHCVCSCKLSLHSKSKVCECTQSLPNCNCFHNPQSQIDLALWCVKSAPNIARLYANLGYILRKHNKTMIQLPLESIQVCNVYDYSDSDSVGVIQLCCIALGLNKYTSSAYSLLSAVLNRQDPQSEIKLPDGRIMNVTELSNESLNVACTEPSVDKLRLTTFPSTATRATGVDDDACNSEKSTPNTQTTFIAASNNSSLTVVPSSTDQIRSFQSNLRGIGITYSDCWIPESFISSAEYVYTKEGKDGMQLQFDDSALDDVQTLILSQKFSSGSIEDALHICELYIKQLRQKEPTAHGSLLPPYLVSKRYSRALLLTALLYMHLDGPDHEVGRVATSSSNEPTPLHPEEAAQTLLIHFPDYLQDAKVVMHTYLNALDTQETNYDTLYLLVLSKLLRFEMTVGVRSPKHLRLPFAPSFALIGDVKKLCGKNKHLWSDYVSDEYCFYDWLDIEMFKRIREKGGESDGTIIPAGRVQRGYFAADEWKVLQEENPDLSDSVPTMNDLMKMIGLEEVKTAVLKLYKRVAVARKRGSAGFSIPLNFRFVGNPGSGKTVTARLLTQILAELKLRPGEDDAAEKAHQLAVESADKAILEEGKARVKELQESLIEQKCMLAVSSAQERVAALEESLTATQNMLSITANVSCSRLGLGLSSHILFE